jgi:hypothetical protein
MFPMTPLLPEFKSRILRESAIVQSTARFGQISLYWLYKVYVNRRAIFHDILSPQIIAIGSKDCQDAVPVTIFVRKVSSVPSDRQSTF